MKLYKSMLEGHEMKRSLTVCLFLAAGLLMMSGSAFAHHGNSAYDGKNPITLKGTVVEFDFVNPHCQIYLDVTDDKGNVVHWGIESQSPGILVKNGWNRHSLKAGDVITITLVAAKNGAPIGFSGTNFGKIVFADGHELRMNER